MSNLRGTLGSATGGSAIVASAAVASLVAVACSTVLGIDAWPVHLVTRIRVIGEAGGSWGAPWEVLTRTPSQYQNDALAALVRIVIQLGVASGFVAGLALALHTISRILAQWRPLAIRCALGATLRHLLALVSRDLVRLAGLGCVIGLALGATMVAVLAAWWPALISRPPLALPALLAAALAFLGIALLLGVIATALLVILQRGIRTVSELHGAQVTAGGPLILIQSALAVLQLAGLLVVTFASALILIDARHATVVADVARTDSSRVASLTWSRAEPRAANRARRYTVARSAIGDSTSRAVAITSPDAWLGQGKELNVLAICGECRIGQFLIPMTATMVRVAAVAPGALLTGHQALAGRDFAAGDSLGAGRVAILNLDAALRMFPGGDPMGKPLRFGAGDRMEYRVVGVTRLRSPRLFGNTGNDPVVFVPLLQHPPEAAEIVAAVGAWEALRERVAAVEPDAPQIGGARSVADRMEEFIQPINWFGLLFAGLAGSATGVAAWSLVAVMNQMVTLRERDIAIRIAIGAQVRDVERWVLSRSLWIIVAGAAVGVSGARWAGMLLHGTQTPAESDIGFLGLLILLFGVLGMVASWLPARRAARIEPATIWSATSGRGARNLRAKPRAESPLSAK